MGGLQHAFRGSKDVAIGFAARTYLNGRLAAIGEVRELVVDTAARCAKARIALRGETQLVDVDVRQYALDRVDGQDWLTLVDIGASREWLSASLQQFAIGRPFPISPAAATALRLLA